MISPLQVKVLTSIKNRKRKTGKTESIRDVEEILEVDENDYDAPLF